MIKKEFLIPECYVNQIPYCDDCNVQLKDQGTMLTSNPPHYLYKCPKCGKEYYLEEKDIRGYWKWRTI